ncbi:MAG: putative Ig domain-containing protein, partial [Planctomycetes bacterium]|nr:putative Ig domain-containing protein [Planctomycetota bacterium]
MMSAAKRSAFVLFLLTALVPAGCGGGGGGGGAVVAVAPAAPVGLSYSQGTATYVVGIFVNNVPSFSGGAPTSWTVTPALPGGLNLDPATGVISGTPSTPILQSQFEIKATNAGGSTQVTILITVILPPQNTLAYPVQFAVYSIDIAITPNVPQATLPGGSYTIQPALPAGLSISSTSGVISGTPTTASAQTTYTVTEIVPPSSFRVSELTITVELTPPMNLDYDSP